MWKKCWCLTMKQNDKAWRQLFERYGIADEVRRSGQFVISAEQIKQYREPRLMTKFDHVVNLPAPFAENGLSVLPISRGDYVISPFAAYHEFEELSGPDTVVRVPARLQSLSRHYLTSETMALNCAAACGVLCDFLGERELTPTAGGRMGSGDFDFYIGSAGKSRPLSVRGAQIEIDAAYEGAHCLALIEAKCSRSRDFLVRQLYYPYRTWRDRIEKNVRPVFFIFTGGVFYLYEYRFADPMRYDSIELLQSRAYRLDTGICAGDIALLLRDTQVCAEPPDVPFPQANSLERLVNLLELLADEPMLHEEITAQYLFSPRQTGYYTDAGRYLGLVKKKHTPRGMVFALSERGERLMRLGLRQRQLALAGAVLEHAPFHRLLTLWLETGKAPESSQIVSVLKDAAPRRVSAFSTYERRASSVASWLQWVMALARE